MSNAAHALILVRTAALAAAIDAVTELAKSDGLQALEPKEIAGVLAAAHNEIARIAGGSR
jgi:hypothetical protein